MPEEVVELRTSVFIEADDLAVQHHVATEVREDGGIERLETPVRRMLAAHQAAGAPFDARQRAEAVILQLPEPIGVIPGLGHHRQRHALEVAHSLNDGTCLGVKKPVA